MRTCALLAIGAALAAGSASSQATNGFLDMGASVSSRFGPTADVRLSFENLFDSSLDFALRFRAGSEGEGGSVSVSRNTDIGSSGTLRLLTLFDASISDFDSNSFTEKNTRIEIGLRKDVSPNLTYGVDLFARQVDIDDFDAAISPVITADSGESRAIGLRGSLDWTNRETPDLLTPGQDASLVVSASGLGSSRDFIQSVVSGRNTWKVGERASLRLSVAGGTTQATSGSTVHVADRTFLGGQTLRGFEFGGAGPVDSTTGDVLGGANYVTASVEYFQKLSGRPLFVGIFTDAGGAWDLPGVSNPNVDDSQSIRASAGLSLNYATSFGDLRFSLAVPVRKRDADREQLATFAFDAKF